MAGLNQGLPLWDNHLNEMLGGLKRSTNYALGAEQKVGKTAILNLQFVLGPYLREPDAPIYWYYWATEMTRVKTEIGLAVTIANYLFDTPWTVSYMSGQDKDGDGNPILPNAHDYELFRHINENYIIPLMGEYDDEGVLINPGKVRFFDYRENPTGIFKFCVQEMSKHGTIIWKKMGNSRTIERYIPHDSESYHIGIIDHIRGLERERGYSIKENIDQMSSYMVTLRNKLGMSFIVTSHLNRGNTDTQRLKLLGENMYPNNELFKDSGNLGEDVDIVITMFDPTDEKYGLRGRHMGMNIKPYIARGGYRTIHICADRDGPAPRHLGYEFAGAAKLFTFKTYLPPPPPKIIDLYE